MPKQTEKDLSFLDIDDLRRLIAKKEFEKESLCLDENPSEERVRGEKYDELEAEPKNCLMRAPPCSFSLWRKRWC
jgi:hypothetical protein